MNQVRSQTKLSWADMFPGLWCHTPAAMASPSTATAMAMAFRHEYWPCSAR